MREPAAAAAATSSRFEVANNLSAPINSAREEGKAWRAADYCCHENAQGAGGNYKYEQGPTCYWPEVVAGGDVKWAKLLLEKCGVDPNWPQSENQCYYREKSPPPLPNFLFSE